jgi:hypothetical protein
MSAAIDWRALASEVIAYRDSKRFAPSTWDTAPIRMNCINCEIYELEEALAPHSTATISVRHELADIVMYALSLLHDLGADNWEFRKSFHGGARVHSTAADLTSPLRNYAKKTFEAWRRRNAKEVAVCLEILIVAAVDLRTRVLGLSGDIADDVRSKIVSSADRPPTHGKDARS